MVGKLIPFGYAFPGSSATLHGLMQDPNTYIVDIRKTPMSLRYPNFDGKALKAKYQKRYIPIPELGNLNYRLEDRHKGIEIDNPGAGIPRVIDGLTQGFNLIPICACKHYDGCHRRMVVEMVKERMPDVEVVQQTATPGDIIKCLSIRQPFASWLADPQWFLDRGIPPKRIENRDWSTRYRGPLLIHASKQFESGAIDSWSRRWPQLRACASVTRADYPAGAIVGIADLVNCASESDDPWFVGEYGFVLANARPIGPVPYRGSLGLFDVPRSVVEQSLATQMSTLAIK